MMRKSIFFPLMLFILPVLLAGQSLTIDQLFFNAGEP